VGSRRVSIIPPQWLTPSVRFTRAGGFFSVGALAVGIAAVYSGNNLLFLLLGGMLGTIATSGVISSLTLRHLTIERHVIGPTPVQLPLLIAYRIRNGKRRIPSYAVTLQERGLRETAYVPVVPPGRTARAECAIKFGTRGTYDLDVLTVSTGFPFGLFVKVRRVRQPAELVIWPRNDYPSDHLVGGGGGGRPSLAKVDSAPLGARGEFRALREFRPGDDQRDVHWRSSARAGTPVVREYLGDSTTDLWLALDPRGEGGERAEQALAGIASIATAASGDGLRFAVSVGARVFGARGGTGHLQEVLTALARLDFTPFGSAPLAPVGCILFSVAHPQGAVVDTTTAVAP